MNRSADELIEAMAFCVVDRGASAFLIGDNEMARLVEAWRDMKSKCLASELAFEKGKLAGINAAREAMGESSP